MSYQNIKELELQAEIMKGGKEALKLFKKMESEETDAFDKLASSFQGLIDMMAPVKKEEQKFHFDLKTFINAEKAIALAAPIYRFKLECWRALLKIFLSMRKVKREAIYLVILAYSFAYWNAIQSHYQATYTYKLHLMLVLSHMESEAGQKLSHFFNNELAGEHRNVLQKLKNMAGGKEGGKQRKKL